jgi:hypothetical protein
MQVDLSIFSKKDLEVKYAHKTSCHGKHFASEYKMKIVVCNLEVFDTSSFWTYSFSSWQAGLGDRLIVGFNSDEPTIP